MPLQCTHLSIKKCQKSVWKFEKGSFAERIFQTIDCDQSVAGTTLENQTPQSVSTLTVSSPTLSRQMAWKYFTRKSCNWCVFGEIWSAKRRNMICKKSKKDLKLGEVRDQSRPPNLFCHTVSKFKENRKKTSRWKQVALHCENSLLARLKLQISALQ